VRGRPALLVCAVAVLAVAALACGPAATSCPKDDYPRPCPSPPPSFSADVLPVFQAKCDGCHGPGKLRASTPLTTWDEIQKLLPTVVVYVVNCRMPNVAEGGTPLTPAERSTMLDWFVCMTPNN
jgi:hypothetical protein